MRVLITGSKGQLGRALLAALADSPVLGLDLPEHDILEAATLGGAIEEFRPEAVVHAAAMTNVDGCARDPAAAHRVNALGTRLVALACRQAGCAMVYVGTNEVFDGRAVEPYRETDAPSPINPYGESKLAGERFAREIVERCYVARTAWLYGRGGNNFVTKILRLADTAGRLRVVADEIGSPTFCDDLASAIVRLLGTGAYGTYHLVNEGVASRLDYARRILALAGRGHVPIDPVTLAEFERDSRVPPYTPLGNVTAAALGIKLRPWQDALAEYLGGEP